MKVVGMRKINFKAENGDQISGTRIYCTFEDDHIDGVGTEAFFLSDKKMDVPVYVGDEIAISYNKYGKVDKVTVC